MGSAATCDASGGGGDDWAGRAADRPALTGAMTAELGGVAPVIVVPGHWSDADLAYQAEHIATMRLQNSGHNCIAGQVVILSADWAQRGAFLAALRRAYAAAPGRPIWYPRSDDKLAAVADAYPGATWYCDGTRAVVEVDRDAEADAVELG